MKLPIAIDLDKLLEHITQNCFDYGHGILPGTEFVLSATGLLDYLTEQTEMSKEEMGERFDEARLRVHTNLPRKES